MHLPSKLAGAAAILFTLPAASGQAALAGGGDERDCASRTQVSEPVSGLRVTRSSRPLDCTERAQREAAAKAARADEREDDDAGQTVIVLQSGHSGYHIRGLSTSPYVLGAPRS